MATGRGRGGIRRWREWLHRATHHGAADDVQPVQTDEQARPDGGDEGSGGSSGSGEQSGSGGPATAHASLDQVLRRAAAARKAVRHDRTG